MLIHRRGAHEHELEIIGHGAGIYQARWGDWRVWFEAFGEPQEVVDAAIAALAKEIA